MLKQVGLNNKNTFTKGILDLKLKLKLHDFPIKLCLPYTVANLCLHLADAFIQSDLQLHSGYTFFISICVPWESNPQPFVLLQQITNNTN